MLTYICGLLVELFSPKLMTASCRAGFLGILCAIFQHLMHYDLVLIDLFGMSRKQGHGHGNWYGYNTVILQFLKN